LKTRREIIGLDDQAIWKAKNGVYNASSFLEPFPGDDWDDVAMCCMNQLKGKSFKTKLCKLSLGVVVY
jgi:hypothetical protein